MPRLQWTNLSVTEAPMLSPDSVVRGLLGKSMFAVPETSVQVPVPMVAVLAARVAEVTLHNAWSGPAFAAVGTRSTRIVKVSEEAVQVPLLMVHASRAAVPGVKAVTVEAGAAGAVTVAAPDTTAQSPVPSAGVFAASAVEVTLQR